MLSLRSSGELKSPEIENFREIFAFFRKTTPDDKIFIILFWKFTSRHRSTLQCAKFVKIVRREIGEIVRCLPDQNTVSAPSQTVATARIASKVCRGQPPTFGSQLSRFHPNRFTFGRLIAGRVKAVLWALWVNPILAQSDTSLRANNKLGIVIEEVGTIFIPSKRLRIRSIVSPLVGIENLGQSSPINLNPHNSQTPWANRTKF